MTCICIPIIGPGLKEAREQIRRAEFVADLFEFRVDKLEVIEPLLQEAPLPCLLTLGEGGDEKKALHLASLKPAYLDLPHVLPSSLFQEIQSEYPEIQLICSYHDYEQTPLCLKTVYEKLEAKGTPLIKIACHTKSTLDAMRLLHLQKMHRKKLIAVGMGEKGGITRILSKHFGTAITYAALSAKERSAPGQLILDELLNIYRFRQLSENCKIYGLIGNPVDQSIGHLYHNTYFAQNNCDAVYVKMPVSEEEIALFLPLAHELDFSGLSITTPLKEQILPEFGPCNTLKWTEDGLEAYNTDGPAVVELLEEKLGELTDKKILILGAGGLAKGIASCLKEKEVEVLIANRTLARAQEVDAQAISWEETNSSHLIYDVVIQATSVGFRDANASLKLPKTFFKSSCLYFETVAHPIETAFVKSAREAGAELIMGNQLFERQAGLQQRVWG